MSHDALCVTASYTGVIAPSQVSPIVDGVRQRGDAAVREFTAKFDRVDLDAVCVPIEVQRFLSWPGVCHLKSPAATRMCSGKQTIARQCVSTSCCYRNTVFRLA